MAFFPIQQLHFVLVWGLVFVDNFQFYQAKPQVLNSPKVTDWGRWGPFQNCSSGNYVTRYQLKIQAYNAGEDNTALNGVRFFCGNFIRKSAENITSSVGKLGRATYALSCPTYAVGFQLKSQKYQGAATDDVAAINLKLLCSDGTELFGFEDGGAKYRGSGYSQWKICGKGQAICGLQTQVDEYFPLVLRDNTALNNIKVKCCDVFPTNPIGNDPVADEIIAAVTEVPADIIHEISTHTPADIIHEISTHAPADIIHEISTHAPADIIQEISTHAPADIIHEISTSVPAGIIHEISTVAPVDVINEISTIAPVEVINEISTIAPVEVINEISTIAPVEVINEISTIAPVEIIHEISTVAPISSGVLETENPIHGVETETPVSEVDNIISTLNPVAAVTEIMIPSDPIGEIGVIPETGTKDPIDAVVGTEVPAIPGVITENPISEVIHEVSTNVPASQVIDTKPPIFEGITKDPVSESGGPNPVEEGVIHAPILPEVVTEGDPVSEIQTEASEVVEGTTNNPIHEVSTLISQVIPGANPELPDSGQAASKPVEDIVTGIVTKDPIEEVLGTENPISVPGKTTMGPEIEMTVGTNHEQTVVPNDPIPDYDPDEPETAITMIPTVIPTSGQQTFNPIGEVIHVISTIEPFPETSTFPKKTTPGEGSTHFTSTVQTTTRVTPTLTETTTKGFPIAEDIPADIIHEVVEAIPITSTTPKISTSTITSQTAHSPTPPLTPGAISTTPPTSPITPQNTPTSTTSSHSSTPGSKPLAPATTAPTESAPVEIIEVIVDAIPIRTTPKISTSTITSQTAHFPTVSTPPLAPGTISTTPPATSTKTPTTKPQTMTTPTTTTPNSSTPSHADETGNSSPIPPTKTPTTNLPHNITEPTKQPVAASTTESILEAIASGSANEAENVGVTLSPLVPRPTVKPPSGFPGFNPYPVQTKPPHTRNPKVISYLLF